MKLRSLSILSSLFVFGTSHLYSQETEAPAAEATEAATQEDFFANWDWRLEGTGEIGKNATIEVPEGYRFLGGSGTAEVMEAFGNLPGKYDGMIGVMDLDWFVLFHFEDSGYVDDSEKDDLDADGLMKAIKESDKLSNEARLEAGLDTLTTVGWAVKPSYNEATNNLEWGFTLESGDGTQTVNYLTKILGRRGIMHATLVCDPKDLQSVLPVYQDLLASYEYTPGNTYAEFTDGDKVSEYGLKALIAGGGLFAAAKLGLFAKLGKFLKPIAIGVVAVGVGIKKFFFGSKDHNA